MKISSQNLLYLVTSIAEDMKLTTIEDLIKYLKNINSVFESTDFCQRVDVMNKEEVLSYLHDMYAQCYKDGNREKAKAFLDIYEKINNGEFDN